MYWFKKMEKLELLMTVTIKITGFRMYITLMGVVLATSSINNVEIY